MSARMTWMDGGTNEYLNEQHIFFHLGQECWVWLTCHCYASSLTDSWSWPDQLTVLLCLSRFAACCTSWHPILCMMYSFKEWCVLSDVYQIHSQIFQIVHHVAIPSLVNVRHSSCKSKRRDTSLWSPVVCGCQLYPLGLGYWESSCSLSPLGPQRFAVPSFLWGSRFCH